MLELLIDIPIDDSRDFGHTRDSDVPLEHIGSERDP